MPTISNTYVEFRNKLYPVPANVTHLAIDSSGQVYVYRGEPNYSTRNRWWWAKQTGWLSMRDTAKPICRVDRPDHPKLELYELLEDPAS